MPRSTGSSPITGKLAVDHRALERLLNGKQGPVAKVLARNAILVESQAKLNATGVTRMAEANNIEKRGPRVRTGRLRSSISWTLGSDNLCLFAAVGTNVIYGYWLETGLRNGATYPFLKPALQVLFGPGQRAQ